MSARSEQYCPARHNFPSAKGLERRNENQDERKIFDPSGTWTHDLQIRSPSLYKLTYEAKHITSLYTAIPNNEGLQALRFFFDQRTMKKPSSETLLRLAKLVLTLNCFSFANNHYKHVNGVTMGTKNGT